MFIFNLIEIKVPAQFVKPHQFLSIEMNSFNKITFFQRETERQRER